MHTNVFKIEIKVKQSDIDRLGHVNNVIYLKWVQDAAVAHWYTEADKKDQEKLLWVVMRHEIDYKRPAFMGDIIVARTWVGKATDRYFERYTELLRKSDERILAKALTLWAPIDAKTKKPTEVSEEVFRKFSTNRVRM